MELRAYFFGNFYLSSIQQGIQAAHAVVEIGMKYGDDKLFLDWANDHKTMILKNGGDGRALLELYTSLRMAECEYPYGRFKESDAALNGSYTSVGLILPETVFNADKRPPNVYQSEAERLIISTLDSTSLAK